MEAMYYVDGFGKLRVVVTGPGYEQEMSVEQFDALAISDTCEVKNYGY